MTMRTAHRALAPLIAWSNAHTMCGGHSSRRASKRSSHDRETRSASSRSCASSTRSSPALCAGTAVCSSVNRGGKQGRYAGPTVSSPCGQLIARNLRTLNRSETSTMTVSVSLNQCSQSRTWGGIYQTLRKPSSVAVDTACYTCDEAKQT